MQEDDFNTMFAPQVQLSPFPRYLSSSVLCEGSWLQATEIPSNLSEKPVHWETRRLGARPGLARETYKEQGRPER